MITNSELLLKIKETIITTNKVFIEIADKPSSNLDNISVGIIILTNQRLFFFEINNAKNVKKKSSDAAISIASNIGKKIIGEIPVVGFFADLAISSAEISYSLLKKEDNHENYLTEQYSSNKHSFCVPLNRITNCQKYGNRWMSNKKNQYIIICIQSDFSLQTGFSLQKYCIYNCISKNFTLTELPTDIYRLYDNISNELYNCE
jgi:hypothetical protein